MRGSRGQNNLRGRSQIRLTQIKIMSLPDIMIVMVGNPVAGPMAAWEVSVGKVRKE